MDQHPVPRQITTFEFKLIGFMTLKQFLYLIVFIPAGALGYFLFPIPYLNIVVGAIIMLFGAALAFIPIQDRPMDVWLKNFYKRLTSPTQYVFGKKNLPIYFLNDLFFVSDPHKIMAHIESREKLGEYLSKTKKTDTEARKKKKAIQTLFRKPSSELSKDVSKNTETEFVPDKSNSSTAQSEIPKTSSPHPFLTGVIKSNRQIPLPGIMIYLKDEKNQVVRLLKTNPHGIFATYSGLIPGQYFLETKDPKGGYFFDTMKIDVQGENSKPIEIQSKEIL